jgi:hypothetical protein
MASAFVYQIRHDASQEVDPAVTEQWATILRDAASNLGVNLE